LSKDTNGNETSTEDATFLMPGYPLTATVTDINNKPVEGAKVQLSSLELEATTDKNGQAFFQDLPVSTLPVIVNYKGKIKQSSVSTLADQNALAIVLDQKVSSFNYLWVAVVILLLALTIVIYIFRRRHFFSKQHFRPPPPV
jgi:hypothetical protein